MKSHLPPQNRLTVKERKAAMELIGAEFQKKRDKVIEEAAARSIILCVYTLWQEFGFGEKRITAFLKALEQYSDQAINDDTWVTEAVERLRKVGVEINIEV